MHDFDYCGNAHIITTLVCVSQTKTRNDKVTQTPIINDIACH